MAKTAWTLAREKRDEAMRVLGVRTYRGWVDQERPTVEDPEVHAELKAADAAVQDVALQS